MGVLYGRNNLLDKLTAYKVQPAPQDPPGKFETGTGKFECMCGVLGALEYIEWVGETYGDEHVERYASEYTGRRLKFKLGMSAIRSYEYELSRALLDIRGFSCLILSTFRLRCAAQRSRSAACGAQRSKKAAVQC
jgi:selenocysteine lyase/cysteine desulfurase